MASSGLGWEVFAKYQVNADVPQGPILDSATFLLNILMTFLIMLSVIVSSMLMILFSTLSVRRHLICGKLELALELASDDTIFYSKCKKASDLWQTRVGFGVGQLKWKGKPEPPLHTIIFTPLRFEQMTFFLNCLSLIWTDSLGTQNNIRISATGYWRKKGDIKVDIFNGYIFLRIIYSHIHF